MQTQQQITTAATANTIDIELIIAQRFRHCTPRSPEYKAGYRAALACRLNCTKILNPHKDGTAAADAFWAGSDDGLAKGSALIRQFGTQAANAGQSAADNPYPHDTVQYRLWMSGWEHSQEEVSHAPV